MREPVSGSSPSGRTGGCSVCPPKLLKEPDVNEPENCSVRQSGFTLIELVVTIVVLGIGLSAIVGLMSVNVSRGANPLIETRLLQVGQAYLDEIMAKRFAESLVPIAGCTINREEGNRAAFDDVDDYNGLNESPPRTQDSTLMAQFASVRVQVSVRCAGNEIGLAQAQAKRITVRVSDAAGFTQVYSAYRSNHE